MKKQINLIDDLRRAMAAKRLSPEQAAGYIGCTGAQIRRWFKGVSNPTPIYREAIKRGIERIDGESHGWPNPG